jgi:hypothetical protein
MPRIRLLAPVTVGPVTGARGDVIECRAVDASVLLNDGLAVLVREERRETAVEAAPERTES